MGDNRSTGVIGGLRRLYRYGNDGFLIASRERYSARFGGIAATGTVIGCGDSGSMIAVARERFISLSNIVACISTIIRIGGNCMGTLPIL